MYRFNLDVQRFPMVLNYGSRGSYLTAWKEVFFQVRGNGLVAMQTSKPAMKTALQNILLAGLTFLGLRGFNFRAMLNSLIRKDSFNIGPVSIMEETQKAVSVLTVIRCGLVESQLIHLANSK